MKESITRYLPHATIAIVAIMLLSLHFGWLNKFSFDSEYANVQGIDYFAVPKSFLNLLEGKSIFDTWGGGAIRTPCHLVSGSPCFQHFCSLLVLLFSALDKLRVVCTFFSRNHGILRPLNFKNHFS